MGHYDRDGGPVKETPATTGQVRAAPRRMRRCACTLRGGD